MVIAKSISLNEATKEVDAFLMADNKDEVTNDPSDVIGIPKGYTYAPFSKAMTKTKEMGILGSDGQWNW